MRHNIHSRMLGDEKSLSRLDRIEQAIAELQQRQREHASLKEKVSAIKKSNAAIEAELSSLETDISSFGDSFKTQSAKLRNQITSLKTEVSHLNSTMCLLEPLQEQVYNSRAPIFQARGARNIFTEVGRISTDIGLMWLEEESTALPAPYSRSRDFKRYIESNTTSSLPG